MAYEAKSYETILRLRALDLADVVVLDTETTGLDPERGDEILSIGIVDGNGNELFSSYVRPARRRRWPKATEVNGITWNDVKDSPEFIDMCPDIKPILERAKVVVGYNVEFDKRFVESSGGRVAWPVTFDVMREYARAHGKWNDWKGERQWSKLTACARSYGYRFRAHSALEDARATAYCFGRLINDEEYLSSARAAWKLKKAEMARREEEARLRLAREEEARRQAEEARRLAEEDALRRAEFGRIAHPIAAAALFAASVLLFWSVYYPFAIVPLLTAVHAAKRAFESFKYVDEHRYKPRH